MPPRMDDAEQMARLTDLATQPEQWPQADPRDLTTLAFAALLRLGGAFTAEPTPPDPDTLRYLHRLYANVVQRVSVQERGQLLNRFGDALDASHGASYVYGLIATEETEHALIASAALDYTLALPLEDDDPLSGPRHLLTLAANAACPVHTRVGLLSGLLWLGDRRTLPLLDRCWELLTDDTAYLLASSFSGYIYASTVTFLLDWLDACAAADDPKQFALVSAGLQLAGRAAEQVLDVERRFPVWHDDDTPPVRVLQAWPRAAYGELIENRLRHLRATGPQPNILHLTLRAWDLSPLQ